MKQLIFWSAAAMVAVSVPIAANAAVTTMPTIGQSLALRTAHASPTKQTASLAVTCMWTSLMNGRDMCASHSQTHGTR